MSTSEWKPSKKQAEFLSIPPSIKEAAFLRFMDRKADIACLNAKPHVLPEGFHATAHPYAAAGKIEAAQMVDLVMLGDHGVDDDTHIVSERAG